MRIDSDAHQGDCVEDLFMAALEGDVLKAAIQQISKAFPGLVILLVCQDSVHQANNFLIHAGGPRNLQNAFRSEVHRREAWPARLWELELGEIYSDADLFGARNGDAQDVLGPVARALARENPPLDCIIGAIVSRAASRQIAIELRYPKFRDAALRPVLRDAFPRLVRQLGVALRIAAAGQHATETNMLVDSLLDLISLPVVLFDANLRVRRVNARARAVISAGTLIAVAPDHILHLLDPENDLAFSAEVSKLQGNLRQRAAVMLASGADSRPNGILSIARIHDGLATSKNPALVSPDEGTLFALVIEDLRRPVELESETLWRIFKLSPKEAELAMSLLAGESIGALAQRRCISKETLRNQLAVVMRKTSTSRQQELVGLLTRLAFVNTSL